MTLARKQYLKVWRFENAARRALTNKAWAERNPDKVRASVRKSVAAWTARNPDYLPQWRQANREKITGHRLKSVTADPALSLFYAFSELDASPGYERHMLVDTVTPFDLLVQKEEAA